MHDLYMTLRVDRVSRESVREFFEKYGERYQIIKFLIFEEVGDKTKKPHMQGVVVHRTALPMENKDLNKVRKGLQFHFDRKGTELTYVRVREIEKYQNYIVKQENLVYNFGYSTEELDQFIRNHRLVEESMKARVDRKKSLSPMQIMFESFDKQYIEYFDKISREKINGVKHEKLLTDLYIAKFVIDYYGRIAHKSFMKSKMAEAANYIKYNALFKYCNNQFEAFYRATADELVEIMTPKFNF